VNDNLDLLIASLEPRLQRAFLAAIATAREGIDFDALVSALRAGDVDAAISAIDPDQGAFSSYLMERQSAFVESGAAVASGLTKQRAKAFQGSRNPSVRGPILPTEPAGPLGPPTMPPSLSFDGPEPTNIVFRFDMTNPRAEAKIRTEAASRVVGYVDEQVQVARKVIADGFQRGEGPQTIASDIAGRINSISGRREGGIVGLSAPQVGYVDNMRRRLLSGDPDEMMKVLGSFDKDGKWKEGTGQTLRDRRYDRTIKKAIRDVAAGKPNPLSRDQIDEMAAKYSDRLLTRRAEDIARTETAQGVEMARAEATKQALDKAGIPDNGVTKTWVHQGGVRGARDVHLAMNGRTVDGIDMPFILPDGSVMLYPHDPAGGVRNNANCRCRGDQAIDWAYGL